MSTLARRNFDEPDQTRTPPLTTVEVVELGPGTTAARLTLEPGWRWSECVQPVAGGSSCQTRHVGVVVSGHIEVTHEDGSVLDLGAGDAYLIEPGHDARVTGNEPYVAYEFDSVTAAVYATHPAH
jgi:mannose-6-phosphate isomerase-like protein (cupin superfamily)